MRPLLTRVVIGAQREDHSLLYPYTLRNNGNNSNPICGRACGTMYPPEILQIVQPQALNLVETGGNAREDGLPCIAR
jgi:hypothetical protein